MLDAVHEAASLHLLDCKIVVLDLRLRSSSAEDEDRQRPLKILASLSLRQRFNQCCGATARHTYLIVVRLGLTAATGYSGALAPGPLASPRVVISSLMTVE